MLPSKQNLLAGAVLALAGAIHLASENSLLGYGLLVGGIVLIGQYIWLKRKNENA
jgi:hypothetical protein